MQSIFRSVARARPRTLPSRPVGLSPTYPRLGIRTLITKRYTNEHETVSFDDATGVGVITITDYAQSTLGDVVFVELPEIGTKVAQGDAIGTVESVKAASDIYAPVSGTVEAINQELAKQPALLNKSAEQDGWLCKIKLSDPKEIDELLTEEKYKQQIQ